MIVRDSEFSEEIIEQFIQADTIGRNQYLNAFMGSLNSIDKNACISVDANWGAGKTVFMKQIEYLNYCPLEAFNAPGLENSILSDFQSKYIVFYYNAWENDYHDDPLQSLLFSLINRLYTDKKRKSKVKSLTTAVVGSIAKEAVKSFTKGIVDLEKIIDATTVNDLVGSITTANERKKAISDIIGEIVPDGMKLLFVVDELDRCNPEFAMRLIEIIKHYYNEDNIVFVVSTNKRELINTVKKYYGNGFDGYGYLDKLYDLTVELPEIDVDKYFHNVLKVPNNSYFINISPVLIAKYLNMTMREVNRYNSIFSLIKGRLDGGGQLGDNDIITPLTHFVFIPLALALKIRSIELYDKFISGDGESLIRGLYASSEALNHISTRGNNVQDQSAVDTAIESYKALINSKDMSYNQQDYNIAQAGSFFRSTLPLIASISKIDDSDK